MLPKEGDLFARRYRIVRAIGRGAMGIVMEAAHETLGTKIAIKILRPDTTDERATKRFLREAKLASSLHSEHVVKVLDVDRTEDDTPYIVMELLEGRDLAAELVTRTSAVPYQESARWMLDVCDAMKEAHAAGIIHRDLKLSNVFLCNDGRIKVLDFGVAGLGPKEAESSTVTTVAGTTRYMAPEQLLGEQPDPRSDVWAIGVMLYRLVSGRFPYEAPTPAAQMLAIMEGCPPLESLVPDVPAVLARITHTALGRTLEERCPSIDVLQTELRALVPDVARPRAVATPEPSRPRRERPARKARVIVLLLLGALAMLSAVAASRRRNEKPTAPMAMPAAPLGAPANDAADAGASAPPPAASSARTAKSAAPAPKPSAKRPSGDGFPTHL